MQLPSLLEGVAELIEQALPLVPEDSLDAAPMLISYATAVYFTRGDYDSAQQAFTRAEDLARNHGERALEIRILAAAAGVDLYHARFAEGAERGARALELARREGDLLGMASASWLAGQCLIAVGELERAETCARAGIEPSERLRDHTYMARVYFCVARVTLLQGDLNVARRFCELGLALAPGEGRLLSTLAVVEGEAGNLDVASAYVERLLEAWTESRAPDLGMGLNGAQAGAVLALITRDVKRSGYVRAAEEVLSTADAPEYYRQIARWVLGVFTMQQGDSDGARRHYLQLRLSSAGLNLAFMQADRVLGLLARTMGDAQAAAAHFEDALAFCRKGGYRPEYAWTCLDYAELLLDEADSRQPSAISTPPPTAGDRARATDLLNEGLQIARELGMRPLVERILGHLQIVKA